MPYRKILRFLTICLFLIDSVAAAQDHTNQTGKNEIAIATSFGEAEPFPARIGIMSQLTFYNRVRISGGWGFSREYDEILTTVGFSAKLIPYAQALKDNHSLRTLVGVSFSRIETEHVMIAGIESGRRVASLYIGAELQSPSFLNFNCGVVMPLLVSSHPGFHCGIAFKLADVD